MIDVDWHVGQDPGAVYTSDASEATPNLERVMESLTGPLECALVRAKAEMAAVLRKAERKTQVYATLVLPASKLRRKECYTRHVRPY